MKHRIVATRKDNQKRYSLCGTIDDHWLHDCQVLTLTIIDMHYPKLKKLFLGLKDEEELWANTITDDGSTAFEPTDYHAFTWSIEESPAHVA